MSDEKVFEVEIRVRSGQAGDEAVRHLEGPLGHKGAEEVAADLVGVLSDRSDGRIKRVADTERARENLKIAERYVHDVVERAEAEAARREG